MRLTYFAQNKANDKYRPGGVKMSRDRRRSVIYSFYSSKILQNKNNYIKWHAFRTRIKIKLCSVTIFRNRFSMFAINLLFHVIYIYPRYFVY